MPSCWTCEQFLYVIKTQCRRRRLRRRLGQRMSGCHIGQVEAIPEAGPGVPHSESSLSQDPYFQNFRARRIEPSHKGTTA